MHSTLAEQLWSQAVGSPGALGAQEPEEHQLKMEAAAFWLEPDERDSGQRHQNEASSMWFQRALQGNLLLMLLFCWYQSLSKADTNLGGEMFPTYSHWHLQSC